MQKPGRVQLKEFQHDDAPPLIEQGLVVGGSGGDQNDNSSDNRSSLAAHSTLRRTCIIVTRCDVHAVQPLL